MKKKNKQNTALTSSDKKPLVKKYTDEETRDIVKRALRITCDPDVIWNEIKDNLIPEILEHKSNVPKELEGKFKEQGEKALMALGHETHFPIAESVSDRYRPMAIEFARQLEKEYDCKTSSEKAMAGVIAGAHARIIEYSRQLNDLTRIEFLSHEKNGFYGMVSRELDRAERHFFNGLTTLKQMKSPNVELNVKAKTAFVSQNQQINAINRPPGVNENNEPK